MESETPTPAQTVTAPEISDEQKAEMEAELAQLREFGNQLAAVENSPWQPGVISRAFARPAPGLFTFTMQGWIDLDFIRSPFLLGGLPEGEEAAEQIAAALPAFDQPAIDVGALEPEEAMALARTMRHAVVKGFSTALAMTPPEGKLSNESHGFGNWLPVLGLLVKEGRTPPEEALKMPVCKAFALVAVSRYVAGWKPKGETYAMKDLEELHG